MCLLRVSSKSESFGEFLKTTSLPVYRSHERGDVRPGPHRSRYGTYGFECDVSTGRWNKLSEQIDEAISFLDQFEPELKRLTSSHAVDDIRLDFPHDCRLTENCLAQFDYLPPGLMRRVGALGIGIEMSLYPAPAREHAQIIE